MIILGMDSSAKAASVCLTENGKVIGHLYQNTGLTHSQTLVPMVQQLFVLTGRKLSEVDGIAVAGGPGSFTGLRIGMAAAKGLALGVQKGICSVSTLAAMAEPLRPFHKVVCAVMDARRNQVYNAIFDENGNRLCEDRAISLEELKTALESIKNPVLLVGDGTELCYNALNESLPNLEKADDSVQCLGAMGAALYVERTGSPFENAGDVVPTYLRLSQAERERNERLNKNS